MCQSIRAIKQAKLNIGVICDVALDPYTSHGHDGVIRHNYVANDETDNILCKQAVLQAQQGCDVIAPSDMMDGRVGAVRQHSMRRALIMCSFCRTRPNMRQRFMVRFAMPSDRPRVLAPATSERIRWNPANGDESIREVAARLGRGCRLGDGLNRACRTWILFRRVHEEFGVPTFAYQVSGEYAMICAAANNGWLDRTKCMLESLLAFKRAGAAAY